jgi:hypothetical protein
MAIATVTSSGSITASPLNSAFNYTLAINIPIPFPSINLSLNSLLSAALTEVGVPAAITSLIANATQIFQSVVNDAMLLIKAIPQATVTIQVKVGAVAVINVQLVAVKTPVPITAPKFSLGLPNLAAGAGIKVPGFSTGAFALPPVVIEVPLPYPVIALTAITSAGTVALPQPITNPTYLPALK